MTNNNAFYKATPDLPEDLFRQLSALTTFEPVAKGRLGNHLVKVDDKGVPIVRTTTKYNIPAQPFAALHDRIIACINECIKEDAGVDIPAQPFNNALIEVYDATYVKMNYHSDQALDLAEDSHIGVFSCYEHPEVLSPKHIRKLKIRDKVSNEESEMALTHHSVVLFSVATNTKFQHKIILEPAPGSKMLVPDNKWLGITFRVSKTYIQFIREEPCFSNGKRLELANEEQETDFYKLRGQENRSTDFTYPELTYTLNAADMMIPGGS